MGNLYKQQPISGDWAGRGSLQPLDVLMIGIIIYHLRKYMN